MTTENLKEKLKNKLDGRTFQHFYDHHVEGKTKKPLSYKGFMNQLRITEEVQGIVNGYIEKGK
jgi:hypothetical protein